MGSKSRIVDNILPIIQERLRDYNIKTFDCIAEECTRNY